MISAEARSQSGERQRSADLATRPILIDAHRRHYRAFR
ncbi:MAG: hypothetical protein ACI8PT_004593, partial [Gammaproteobacteria bacterium]